MQLCLKISGNCLFTFPQTLNAYNDLHSIWILKLLNRFDTVMYNIFKTCSYLTIFYVATEQKPLPTTEVNEEKRLEVR